jgi:hypothetical protein
MSEDLDDLVSSEIKQLADLLYLRKLITIDGWALVRQAEREIAGRDAVKPGSELRAAYAQAVLDELLSEGEAIIVPFALLIAPVDVRVRAMLKVLSH